VQRLKSHCGSIYRNVTLDVGAPAPPRNPNELHNGMIQLDFLVLLHR